MIGFHLSYDLKFIAGVTLVWFAPPLQDVWRASISWSFLFIAGWMCSLSHDNLKRSLKYAIVALAIYVVTSLAGVDDPISFGIIYCVAFSTFVAWVLTKVHLTPKGPVAAVVLLVCFVLTLNVPHHVLGIGGISVTLPSFLYETPWLSWLGLPGGGFVSGDYYPPIPFTFMYLCGMAIGTWVTEEGRYPDWAYSACVRPLNFLGRHALAVYILHQPILLLLTGIIQLPLG